MQKQSHRPPGQAECRCGQPFLQKLLVDRDSEATRLCANGTYLRADQPLAHSQACTEQRHDRRYLGTQG